MARLFRVLDRARPDSNQPYIVFNAGSPRAKDKKRGQRPLKEALGIQRQAVEMFGNKCQSGTRFVLELGEHG